ncbi:ABC transporter permease [Namhaeicola litoreus]|uniref:ABC transporter permease n=1 Tax=Namhaeicola litoreus TaxID=1052145 RepID=A0ABW3Y502_9FLAO
MNYELFIAKRIIASKGHKSSVSSPIIKIAIVAIAIGIVVMILSIATGIGLQKKIKEKISGFNGDVQVTFYDANNSNITLNPVKKNQDFYPNFEKVPNVKKVQPFATSAGIIRTEENFEGVILKGVDSDHDWTFFKDYLVEGDIPVLSEKLSNDVLISSTTANKLKLKVGDHFYMFFVKDDPNKAPNTRKFFVSGIFNSGFQEIDEGFIVGDIKHIQRINKWKEDEVGGFEILLYDFDDLYNTGNEIYQNIDPNLNATTVAEKFPAIFEWLDLFDTNIVVIIFIMILVAGINMITALLVLILERSPMIGVLKALGESNWSIRKIFLYNAAYLIGVGLFWGNLIGLALIYAQKTFGIIKLNAENYYVTEAPVHIDLTQIFLLNLGTLLLCLTMLLIPSYIVTKISPVKAIKFN